MKHTLTIIAALILMGCETEAQPYTPPANVPTVQESEWYQRGIQDACVATQAYRTEDVEECL